MGRQRLPMMGRPSVVCSDHGPANLMSELEVEALVIPEGLHFLHGPPVLPQLALDGKSRPDTGGQARHSRARPGSWLNTSHGEVDCTARVESLANK